VHLGYKTAHCEYPVDKILLFVTLSYPLKWSFNMKNILLYFCIVCLGVSLTGCASNTKNQNAGYGAAAGLAVGVLASNPILAVGGAAVGMAVGHSWTSSDDE
jgi:hypothetical protein